MYRNAHRMVAIAAALACGAGVANAQSAQSAPTGRLERIRKAYEQRDYETVRAELLAAYEEKPEPELLFALGQVELNLGDYDAAIGYYEKFIAANPSAEQIALAQQAIGAARMKLAAPETALPPLPAPVPPPSMPPGPERPRIPPRRWHGLDTAFVVVGSGAVLAGGGLLYYSHRLGNDTSGSLSEYDDRVARARLMRWTGIGAAATGALVIGTTLLRWRLRPDGGDLTASIAPGAATFAFTGLW